MAWLEVHQSLITHRKTLAAADLLDIPPAHLVGHLVCLWLWCLDNAEEGDLSTVSDRTISRAAQWDGSASDFVRALAETRFLNTEEGCRAIHDWDDYAGRLMAQRRANTERKRAARRAKDFDPGDMPGTSSAHPGDVPDPSPARPGATVPDPTRPHRTQQNQTGPHQIKPAAPTAVTATAAAGGDSKDGVSEFVATFLTTFKAELGRDTPRMIGELIKFDKAHQLPSEIAKKAIYEASYNGQVNWPYIRAILVRWYEDGLVPAMLVSTRSEK